MRQITLDIETTGLSTQEGDRIIEIGCVEIINREITGKEFHTYCNPERAIGKVATQITGIADKFLLDKPKFAMIVNEFLNFLAGANELIIHNANFDLEFIHHELNLLSYPIQDLTSKFKIVDTLVMARTMYPGQRNNLDALVKRHKIDCVREFHGALVDAKILANLLLKMTAGQISLDFNSLLIDNNKNNYLNDNNYAEPITINQDICIANNKHANYTINSNKSDINMDDILPNIKLKVIYANQEELSIHNNYLNSLAILK